MTIDEKFCHHRKGHKVLNCTPLSTMNTAPPNEYLYGKEENRVSIRFCPENDEDTRRLVVRMSRAEAKQLGEQLVRYGNMQLDSEKVLTPSPTSGNL